MQDVWLWGLTALLGIGVSLFGVVLWMHARADQIRDEEIATMDGRLRDLEIKLGGDPINVKIVER